MQRAAALLAPAENAMMPPHEFIISTNFFKDLWPARFVPPPYTVGSSWTAGSYESHLPEFRSQGTVSKNVSKGVEKVLGRVVAVWC